MTGGIARGYQLAEIEVTGVDIVPQKRYVGEHFICADALEFLADGGWKGFDAIHASPPCQGYSVMRNLPWLKEKEYPLLILPVREMLERIGLPYVIENVFGARYGSKQLAKRGLESHGMKAGWLCGTMFGRPFYRHRLFETSFFWMQPGHPKHQGVIKRGRNLGERQHDVIFSASEDARGIKSWPGRDGERGSGMAVRSLAHWQGNGAQAAGVGIGHAKGWRLAAEAMEIDWPATRDEVTQMIPPCYSKFIGTHLRSILVITPSQEPGSAPIDDGSPGATGEGAAAASSPLLHSPRQGTEGILGRLRYNK